MNEVEALTEIQNAARVALAQVEEEQFAQACEAGDVECVKKFLQHGFATEEVSAQGRTPATPLIIAARAGRVECVRAILDAGASVDAACGPEQETAIHVAATCGRIEVMEVLIAASGLVDPLDVYGRSPVRNTNPSLQRGSNADPRAPASPSRSC